MVIVSYYILSFILPLFGYLSPGTFIDDPNVILGDQRLNCNKIVEIMPDNSILSLYVKDISVIKNELKNTNVASILEKPELKEPIKLIKKRIQDDILKAFDGLLTFEKLESIFSDGELGFSILEGKKIPSFVFIYQLDEKNKYAVNDFFTQAINKLQANKILAEENYLANKVYKIIDKYNNKFEMQFCISNNFFYLTIADKNSNYLQKTLDNVQNRKNALSDNQFMDIVKKRASSSDLMFVDINCQRLFKFLENRWTNKSSDYYRRLQVIKKSGLDQITHINHSERINNGNFEELLSATIKSKNGVFKILDSFKKLDKDFVKLTPADSIMTINANISIKEVWNYMQYVVEYIFPSEYNYLNKRIFDLNKGAEANVVNELFSGFSGPVMLVTSRFSKSNLSAILEIKDIISMKSILFDKFFKSVIKTKISKTNYNQYEINKIEAYYQKLYFCLTDKYLIISMSEKTIKSILDTINKKSPMLYDNNIQFKNILDNNLNSFANTNYLCFLNSSILNKIVSRASSKSASKSFMFNLCFALKDKNLMGSQIISSPNQGTKINSSIPLSFEFLLTFFFLYA